MGLPRHVLPQIPSDQVNKFITFLGENGVEVKRGRLSVAKLKPIQQNVNVEKVERIKADPKALKLPLIISKEGFVLDGHHRWAALTDVDDNMLANVILCECSIKELIGLGHQFEGSFTRTVHETTIYIKGLWEDEENDALPIVRKTLYPY